MMQKNGPLKGVKVLELGSLIAGPFAGRLFGDFGAEVIKVEPPHIGDPLRKWRLLKDGTSLWWYVQSRNKKCITLNLKVPQGQEIIKKLAKEVDIIIENFKPGTLEKWNIGYEDLKKINPKIIMVRISGYGQDGPYSAKPGFGSIGEALGGIRYLSGYPDLPPVRTGISIGDSVAAIYAVMSAVMAIYHRDVNGTQGQYIDVALYEAIFSLMESLVPEYDQFKFIRERSGNTLPGIAPSNIYLCNDGKYVAIGANGDSIFQRLTQAMGREDLAQNEAFKSNDGRAKEMAYLDAQITQWTVSKTIDEVLEILDKYQIPSGAIYNVADMFKDAHFKAREMIQDVEVEGLGTLKMPGIMPKFSNTPGSIQWSGLKLGESNREIYGELLGLSSAELSEMETQGII
ncbi:CaiB/BaiF CoA transferase family protein [Sulfurospirillum sp. 1612]|uniref:CaiB/BaiF CoA transferase family protein n=1 Tax=Sulfurospirillum sp. 1612 TaxID=3094835 RepID=UPI002F932B74